MILYYCTLYLGVLEHTPQNTFLEYIFRELSLKGECSVFKIFFIMDENDTLSEYNKISLGHNRTNSAVYSKIDFKVEICSAHVLDIRKSSHASFPALILLKPNNHYNHGFHTTFDYNHYVYSDYFVCSVPVIAHILRY